MAALALGLLAGCGGCRCAGQGADSAPRREAERAPAPSADWLAGRLPDSVFEGTPISGGTLTVRLHAEPPHLSPHLLDPTDLIATRLTLGRVYDTLLRIDSHDHPRYRLLPGAAESYAESDDHLTYTFRLREGMRFHDGQPVTAEDLVATLRLVLDPTQPTASARTSFLDVVSYEALDSRTFRVTLARPYFLALRQLATTLPILPKHLIEVGDFRSNQIHRAPVGSGPWRFVRWKTYDEIVFERNDDYWGPKPFLDRLVFRIVPDQTVATQLFERGDFDLMTQIAPGAWEDMANNPSLVRDYNRIRFFPKNYEWVGWNERREFFADRRVRRAMALLFDRESFNRKALRGLEKPTTCHFYLDGPNCDPSLEPLPYAPEEARRLLDDAGWTDRDGDGILDRNGKPFRFTFLVPTNSVFLGKLTLAMQQAYRKAGIQMEIASVEWAVYSKRVHDHDFDACSMIWGDTDVESDPFQVWHSSQQYGSNFVGFADAQADHLIEQARVEFDPERRSALFRDLGGVLYAEQPYMWLNVRPDLDAVHVRVKGIRPSINFYDFGSVWLQSSRSKLEGEQETEPDARPNP